MEGNHRNCTFEKIYKNAYVVASYAKAAAVGRITGAEAHFRRAFF